MTPTRYDTIIIGSGPTGEGAAMQLAKGGQKVALVEEYPEVGGGCTHWGTIPSKALLHVVQQLSDYRSHPLFQSMGYVDVSYKQLVATANSVIHQQVKMRRNFYFRNRVEVISGRASFVDANTIEVETQRRANEHFTADAFVIATGSHPYRPDDIEFSHPLVHDSDTILDPANELPRAITIYGAGTIGCEYASIFSELGVKVDLVNTRDRLLSFLDDEISDALSYHLRDHGVVIRHLEEYDRVETADDCVTLHCKSGKHFKNDLLLWANGRTGNTQNMGLEGLGVVLNHRGQVEVNDRFQTQLEHIYAAGDVIGPPALASASYDQGRFAAHNILCENSGSLKLVQDIPTGIYTSPEISSLGPTERELTEQKIPYEVGRAMFRSIARAQITGHTVGMVKILFHTETLEILGLHCFGAQAAEIIHIGQAIMSQKGEANTLMYFVETTFNYPTMAEAYRVAALNGLNRVL